MKKNFSHPKTAALPGKVRIIGGKWRGRQLKVTPHDSLRPTSDRTRETLFNWLTGYLNEAYCLDLFAGTGVLGFEALSRGASQVVFVDSYFPAIQALKATAQGLQATEACQIYCQSAITYLQQPNTARAFDIIFLDPPFTSSHLPACIQALTKSPMIHANTLIYIEVPKGSHLDLPAGWQLLKQKSAGQVIYHLIQGA